MDAIKVQPETTTRRRRDKTGWSASVPDLLWAGLGLLLLVLLLYARLLFTNRVLASGDILHYFYPYRDYAAEALRAHRLPLWNPYIFNGAPFLANPQAAVLYPLFWPLSWLAVTKQIYWSAALHTWLLGIGGYLLMRRWSYGGLPAFVTALVLAGSGFYGGLLGHINQMNAAAWLPWLLLVIDGAVASDDRKPDAESRALDWPSILVGAALFGLLTALMLLAGHTQTAYINLFGVGVWVVWPLVSRVTLSHPGRQIACVLPALLTYGLGVLVGLLLSAMQLLPTLELSALGLRSGGLSYAEASSFSLKPLQLPWSLLPTYGLADLSVVFGTLGYSEFVAYVGFVGLILALYGAWQRRSHPDRAWTLGLLFVCLGLFLAAGRWNPFTYLFYTLVPGFDLFRAPARWMMLYTMGMAVLAGVGVEAINAKIEEQRSRSEERRSEIEEQRTCRPRMRSLIFALRSSLFVLLLASDLLLASRALPHTQTTAPQAVSDLRTAPAHLLTDPQRTIHPAAAGRFLSMSTITFDPGDMADYRRILLESDPPQLDQRAFDQLIVALKSQEILAPNLSLLWRVPAVDGFDGGVLPLDRYLRFLTLFVDDDALVPDGRLREQIETVPDSALLGLLNTQYVITDKVRDLWFDGVYYDRQIGARLSEDGLTAIDIDVPLAFEATHVDLIGYVEGTDVAESANQPVAEIELLLARDASLEPLILVAGGEPGAHFADGALDSRQAEGAGVTVAFRDVEGERQEYQARFALDRPVSPQQVSIAHNAGAAPVVIQAVTLIDERTGMFEALLPSDRGRFERVHSGDVKIYENLDLRPRAYLVNDWVPVAGPDAALDSLRRTKLDSSVTAVVEGDLVPDGSHVEDAPGRAAIVAYAPERVEVEIESDSLALLVLSDSFYPGWQATVDGQKTPVFPTNLLFRGVVVPAGHHVVTFTFEPDSVRTGAWITLLGAVLTGILLLGAQFLSRRNRPLDSSNR